MLNNIDKEIIHFLKTWNIAHLYLLKPTLISGWKGNEYIPPGAKINELSITPQGTNFIAKSTSLMGPTVCHLCVLFHRLLSLQPHLVIKLFYKRFHSPVQLIVTQ